MSEGESEVVADPVPLTLAEEDEEGVIDSVGLWLEVSLGDEE